MDDLHLLKLQILGIIAELPEEERSRVGECIEKMRSLLKEYAPYGHVALALLGAESAAENSDDL